MLALEDAFLKELLMQFSEDRIVHIVDADTQIVASTQPERIGSNSSTAQYIINIRRTASIENASPYKNENKRATYGAPVFQDAQLCGVVVVHHESTEAAIITGDHIRLALESALIYNKFIRNNDRDEKRTDEIARILLSDGFDSNKMKSLMNQLELDPTLLRTVICIRLQYHQTNYFNINLNLGYKSSIEETHADVQKSLQNNRYLNAQDIVYQRDRNTIIILKSFIPIEDQTRVYLSLDKICDSLSDDLANYLSLDFHIAYGNLYTDLQETRRSFQEAQNTISIALIAGIHSKTYALEDVLFERVYQTLPSQLTDKLLHPMIAKLRHRDGSLYREVVDCAEVFVENCMSIALTAEKSGLHRNTVSMRLARLQSLTGLDPANSLQDAFVTKMLAVYLRMHHELPTNPMSVI